MSSVNSKILETKHPFKENFVTNEYPSGFNECLICLDQDPINNEKKNQLIVLSCSVQSLAHTICTDCFQAAQKCTPNTLIQKNKITCPYCREQTPMPEALNGNLNLFEKIEFLCERIITQKASLKEVVTGCSLLLLPGIVTLLSAQAAMS